MCCLLTDDTLIPPLSSAFVSLFLEYFSLILPIFDGLFGHGFILIIPHLMGLVFQTLLPLSEFSLTSMSKELSILLLAQSPVASWNYIGVSPLPVWLRHSDALVLQSCVMNCLESQLRTQRHRLLQEAQKSVPA